MNDERTDNLNSRLITDFGPNDTIYAQRKVRGFSYVVFGKFVKFERGCVTVTGRIITPEWADARDFGATEREGVATITVRLKSCYLWGKAKDDPHARCHWFKSPDYPVT